MVAYIDTGLILGIAAGASAALCYDGSNVLQAGEARQVAEPVLKASLLGRLLRRPRWVAATGLAILGWPLQVLALTLAPLSVVQPTLAIGLLLLLYMGSRMYDEPVTRGDLIATLAILGGVGGLALCAPPEHTTTGNHAATAVILAALTLLAVAPFAMRRSQPALLLIAASGSAYTVTGIASNLLAGDVTHSNWLPAAAWMALIASVAAVGLIDEMGAMQRMAVARVAVPIFVIQTAVPVALAPVVAGESWSSTPGSGAGIVVSVIVCSVGAGWLARSSAVDALIAHQSGVSDSTAEAADGRAA